MLFQQAGKTEKLHDEMLFGHGIRCVPPQLYLHLLFCLNPLELQ